MFRGVTRGNIAPDILRNFFSASVPPPVRKRTPRKRWTDVPGATRRNKRTHFLCSYACCVFMSKNLVAVF